MTPAPAVWVVVMAGAGGGASDGLRERLGEAGCARLGEVLLRRALDWAQALAPGRVRVADESAGAGESLRMRHAVEAAATDGGGPVVVIWPELSRWRPEHADGLLDDLGAGCEVVVGPVFDGGCYLLGLARPVASLLELPDDVWHGPEAMGRLLGAAHEADLSAGLLRPERGLRTAADVNAARADPLLDDELAGLLGG